MNIKYTVKLLCQIRPNPSANIAWFLMVQIVTVCPDDCSVTLSSTAVLGRSSGSRTCGQVPATHRPHPSDLSASAGTQPRGLDCALLHICKPL